MSLHPRSGLCSCPQGPHVCAVAACYHLTWRAGVTSAAPLTPCPLPARSQLRQCACSTTAAAAQTPTAARPRTAAPCAPASPATPETGARAPTSTSAPRPTGAAAAPTRPAPTRPAGARAGAMLATLGTASPAPTLTSAPSTTGAARSSPPAPTRPAAVPARAMLATLGMASLVAVSCCDLEAASYHLALLNPLGLVRASLAFVVKAQSLTQHTAHTPRTTRSGPLLCQQWRVHLNGNLQREQRGRRGVHMQARLERRRASLLRWVLSDAAPLLAAY